MVIGIGIDIVTIKRFHSWVDYGPQRLSKIFTHDEMVAYLREMSDLSDSLSKEEVDAHKASYLGARFAAKEAFYKALSNACIQLKMTKTPFSFLFTCQHAEVYKHAWGVPQMKVDLREFEKKIGDKFPKLKTHLSISHEREFAVAEVIISL